MKIHMILIMLQLLICPLLSQQQNFSLVLDSAHSNSFLRFVGDANQYSDHVELTKNGNYSAGRLYHTKAVRLREPCNSNRLLSFSTSFTFQMATPLDPSLQQGDGMAFHITYGMPDVPRYGTGSGLGMINQYADHNTMWLFAVEFDPFQNTFFQDPDKPHVGIDINSLVSVATVVPPDDIALDKNFTLTAWVDYIASTEEVQIRLSRNTTKPEQALLKHTVSNLSDVIQDTMYLGFSAGTGEYTRELNVVKMWNFSVSESAMPNCSVNQPASKQNTLAVPILIAFMALLTLVTCFSLLAAGWLWWKLKKAGNKHIMQLPIITFTYSQLRLATKNFSQHNILGRGAFGCVYRGDLANGTLVAVKILSKNIGESELQFVAELSVISHLRHKNLLSLIGWCHEKGKLLLVYDYMPNGSLGKCLFNSSYVLSWQQRYNIVLGIAEGLAFLHHGWEQKVVHRDIKASNVLLDNNFVAHVGDFGLAKLLDSDRTEVDMTRLGTFGYIAPELLKMGKASEKSDVYSFGILILEISTGRRVLDANLEAPLIDWIWWKKEEGDLLHVADPKLENLFDTVQMTATLLLGLLCCQENPHDRPSMRKCCNVLKGDESLPFPLMMSSARSSSSDSTSDAANMA